MSQNLIKDIYPGTQSSSPIFIASLKSGLLFFSNNFNTGYELWITDGTNTGTRLLKDINPGTATSFTSGGFYLVDTTVFLWMKDTSTSRISLWKTNGTTTGTKRIKRFTSPAGPTSNRSEMAKTNGKLIFAFDDGSGLGSQLWVSDGTETGTKILKLINGNLSSSPSNLVEMGGKVYFFATSNATGHELWTTDGTESGTQLVIDLMPGIVSSMFSSTSPIQLVACKNQLFLSAISDVDTGYELYVSDGTAAGTRLVKNLNNTRYGNANVQLLAGAGNFAIFSYFDSNISKKMACSDGTAVGTFDFMTINNSATFQTSPKNFIVMNDRMFFSLFDFTTGTELYSSDGTPSGTGMVLDISPGNTSSSPTAFTIVDDKVYFAAINNLFGKELWSTTGKGGSTQLVLDFNPGSNSGNFTSMMAHNGVLYASAFNNATIGNELYDFNTKILLTIDDELISQYSIYPNPVRADQTLFIESNKDTKCLLYDAQGKLILDIKVNDGKIQLPERMSSGIYILQIEYDDFKVTKKLIVE